MQNILNFIIEYRFILLVVLGVFIFAIAEWGKFKKLAYSAILNAKRLAKDMVLKSGKQQEDWVVGKMYQYLPKKITRFISEKNMRRAVHYLYHQLKDYMDNGRLDNSIE